MKKVIALIAIFAIALAAKISYKHTSVVIIPDGEVALASSPTISYVPAQGKEQKKSAKAIIDYSYANEGYITINFTQDTKKKIKVQVKGPTTTYTYNLVAGKWECFPLSDGNGKYTIGVFENASGSQYSSVVSHSINVKLKDEFGPFLYPNQYVNYAVSPNTVAKANELCKSAKDNIQKVEKVYDFVVDNITYNKDLASSVQSGYLPVLDNVLKNKKGICFDYAALMTGMLRSQGVPCKLVIGYAGTTYHAWINVWTKESGWVDNVIQFDGVSWHRMDPTFASSSKKSNSIMKYIGDGKNYSVKYLY